MPYYNIYRKRINRFGENFQDRMQGNREYDFERYLERSIYTQISCLKAKSILVVSNHTNKMKQKFFTIYLQKQIWNYIMAQSFN